MVVKQLGGRSMLGKMGLSNTQQMSTLQPAKRRCQTRTDMQRQKGQTKIQRQCQEVGNVDAIDRYKKGIANNHCGRNYGLERRKTDYIYRRKCEASDSRTTSNWMAPLLWRLSLSQMGRNTTPTLYRNRVDEEREKMACSISKKADGNSVGYVGT